VVGTGSPIARLVSKPKAVEPTTDSQRAQQVDLSGRLLRAVLWLSAAYYAAIAALLKLYAHIPLVVAVVLGVVGVVGDLAVERHLWRRNQERLSQLLDPVTGEPPGGRLPLPAQVRYGLPLTAVALVAVVIYLAAL
jgi:hypothetical protein